MRAFTELESLYQPIRANVKKNGYFWESEFFPSSNHEKPPFSLKLETMRMSKFSTASKNIKNIKSYIYVKVRAGALWSARPTDHRRH